MSKTVTFRLTDAEWEDLNEVAEKKGITVSDVIRGELFPVVVKNTQPVIQITEEKHIQTVIQAEEWPIYNPQVHKPGDKVRVKRGNKYIPTIIPELDGDGNPIPRY